MSADTAPSEPATGVPVSQGLQIGEFCTLAGLPAYVVPPRDPATYDGRALLLLPDVTGTANVHNLILAEQLAFVGNFYTVMPELQSESKAAPESMLAKYEELAALESRQQRGRMGTGVAKVQASVLRSQLAHLRWQHELPYRSQQAVAQVKSLVEAIRHIGLTKVVCVSVGSGAELLTPLAVAGVVNAWAVIHGHASRRLGLRAKTPGIIQCAAHDPFLQDADLVAVRCAVAARQSGAADVQIRHYPGTYHGFAVHGAPKSTLINAAKRQVLRSTVDFLSAALASQPDPRVQCALVGRHSLDKPRPVSVAPAGDAPAMMAVA